MTHDAEAAWPLTGTDPGYYPGPNPAAPPTPHQMPLTPVPAPQYTPIVPMSAPTPKGMTPGMRLGYLGTILGISIPLTAIAGSMLGLLGLGVVWAGIVIVSALAFGFTGLHK